MSRAGAALRSSPPARRRGIGPCIGCGEPSTSWSLGMMDGAAVLVEYFACHHCGWAVALGGADEHAGGDQVAKRRAVRRVRRLVREARI